MTQVTSHSSTR